MGLFITRLDSRGKKLRDEGLSKNQLYTYAFLLYVFSFLPKIGIKKGMTIYLDWKWTVGRVGGKNAREWRVTKVSVWVKQ